MIANVVAPYISCSPLTVAARTDRVARPCYRAEHLSIVYVMASRLGPLGLWSIAGNQIPLRSVPCVRSSSLAYVTSPTTSQASGRVVRYGCMGVMVHALLMVPLRGLEREWAADDTIHRFR